MKILSFCFRCGSHKPKECFDDKRSAYGGWCINCIKTPIGEIPKIG